MIEKRVETITAEPELNSKEIEHVLNSKEDDVALAYYEGKEYTEEQYAKLRRKIDLHILPLMMVTGFLQYLDKQAITYSVLYSLQPDLGLVGSDYSWTNSMFYFGYLVWQYPSLALMQRLPAGKYVATQVVAWGVLCLLMATPSNFAGLATLRFFLGAAESIILAAWTIMINMWYKRTEQPPRMTAWYSMNAVAIMAGGLFAYGVGHIEDQAIALWKYPFLICGSLTFVWSIVLLFLLPNNPSTAWFLTVEERKMAVTRVKDNRTGIESKKFKREQAWEAFTDPKVWLNALGSGAGNVLGGVAAFAGLLIRSFGFTTLQTTLLQSLPTGVIQISSLILFTALATYIKNSRMLLAFVACLISLTGSIMLYAIPLSNKWALMVGFWLMTAIIPNAFILGLGVMGANIGGHTKRITAQAIWFVVYCVGNIVGPQLYKTAPYSEGLRANVVTLAVVTCTQLLTFGYMLYENRKKRDYLEAHPELNIADYVYHDHTDRQNPFAFNVL